MREGVHTPAKRPTPGGTGWTGAQNRKNRTRPNHHTIIELLNELEQAPVPTTEEVLALDKQRKLHGRGCGFVDMSLLTSSLLGAHSLLWTPVKRRQALAIELDPAYLPPLHA